MVRLAAEQGHAGGQNTVGWMYQHGRGVPQSDKDAVKWYRLAAKQGTPMRRPTSVTCTDTATVCRNVIKTR